MSRRASSADIIRLGPNVASIKASMKHRDWAAIVRRAHQGGYTVGGELSGLPDALKERTRASLQQQALATVNATYKPAEGQLDQQATQAQAIADKRAADNKVYNDWLGSQQQKILAQAQAADTQLQNAQQNIETNTAAAWAQAQAGARAQAAGTAGNVSNPDQSKALDFSAQAQRDVGLAGSAHQQTVANMGSGAQALQGMILGQAGQQAASEAQRQGDLYNTLQDIASKKTTLEFQKGADAAKELDSLLQNNASVAASNQDRSIAADKLGVQQAQQALDQQNATRKYKLDSAKFSLDKWTAEHRATADQAKIQLGYDKIKDSDGKAAADRKLRKWIATHQGTARSTVAKNEKAGQTLVSDVKKAGDIIAGYKGASPAQLRAQLALKGIDPDAINAAMDLASPKTQHKLSSATRRILSKRLKGTGVSLPGGWLSSPDAIDGSGVAGVVGGL